MIFTLKTGSLFNGQIYQDRWVCDMLDYKKGGFFLDIGAFDGVQISNTYYLEKHLAWNGICIEAGEKNFKELVKHRDCVCLNMVVSDVNGWVDFAENWTVGKIGEGKKTESITIDALLTNWKVPKVIDYISLDVEGQEYNVITKFPFKDYRVRVWTIEHNAHEDNGEMRDKIRELMIKNRYKLYREQSFEDWYVDK